MADIKISKIRDGLLLKTTVFNKVEKSHILEGEKRFEGSDCEEYKLKTREGLKTIKKDRIPSDVSKALDSFIQ